VRAIEIRERMSKTAKKAFENPEIRKKLSDAARLLGQDVKKQICNLTDVPFHEGVSPCTQVTIYFWEQLRQRWA
jgi:hypothetical protein